MLVMEWDWKSGSGWCGSQAPSSQLPRAIEVCQYLALRGQWQLGGNHPRTGVRTRRATGFWNRPLAGLIGPNVSMRVDEGCFLHRWGLQHEP